MKKVILIISLVSILALSIGLMACYEKPIVAKAAETTAEETEINYYNYTITFNKAPCHFYVPNSTIVGIDYPIIDIFKDSYLYTRKSAPSSEFMLMLYEVLDSDGIPFAREVLQIGQINYVYVSSANRLATNYNSTAYTTSYLSNNTSVSSIRLYNDQGRLYRPSTINWETDNEYRFKIKISVPVDEVINISNYKIRACALVDYYSYPDNKDIWYNYSISNTTSSSATVLTYQDVARSDTNEPIYSVAQSFDSYFNTGYNQGYSKGYSDGEVVAQPGIYEDGYNTGYDNGYRLGETNGYNQGIEEANDYSFLSLTTAVVDAPVKIFSTMFDFNVLGFNMTTFLFSIITLCLVFAVIKRLL